MRLWVGILFYYFIILLFWGQLPGVSAMPWPARDGDGDCEDDDDDGEWWKSEIIIMLVGMKKKKGLKSQTQSASFGKWKINKLPNRWKPAVKISYYLIFTASPTKFFIIKLWGITLLSSFSYSYSMITVTLPTPTCFYSISISYIPFQLSFLIPLRFRVLRVFPFHPCYWSVYQKVI